MNRATGRYLSLSLTGRLVEDLRGFVRSAPVQSVRHCLDLGVVRNARTAAQPRPCWAALWVKAFALVSARRPALRRCFLPFPWARIYEHPEPVALMAIDHSQGDAPLWDLVPLASPDRLSLPQIDQALRRWQSQASDTGTLARLNRLGRWPGWVRRGAWWWQLCASGPSRVATMGTFAVALTDHSLGEAPIWSMLTPTLYRGGMNDRGLVQVRLTFDSRVIDARSVRWALHELEQVMNGEIANELGYLRSIAA